MQLLQKFFHAPLRIAIWLFHHRPWITAVELLILSTINAAVVYVLLYMARDYDSPPIAANLVAALALFLGLLSVIFASYHANNGSRFEVNDYDVLNLTLRDYLRSRGLGIATSYVALLNIAFMLGLVAVVIALPIALLVVLYTTFIR